MNYAEFRFPSLFRQLGHFIPSTIASAPLIAMLALSRNREWLVAPESLFGKRFKIHIEDLGLEILFRCEQGKFVTMHTHDQIDLTLSANAIHFLQLASGMEDADTLFFRRCMKMEGDTALGIAVKYWIDASERPNWLQQLAAKLN